MRHLNFDPYRSRTCAGAVRYFGSFSRHNAYVLYIINSETMDMIGHLKMKVGSED